MNIKKHIKTIRVYTDGSLKKTYNGIKCGYGIYFPDGELNNVAAPFTVGEITNNRAELHAIHQAIIRVAKNYSFDSIYIYTDSEYSKKSLTEWIIKWKKNNWKNSTGKPVENQDIIKKIDKYMEKFQNKIFINWIPAHTGNKDEHSINNDMADKLANKGAEKS